jgi:hypothetical protein
LEPKPAAVNYPGAFRGIPAANDYRRYSAECLALAERVTDSADKARLIQMAQAFLELANKQEQKDSSPGD